MSIFLAPSAPASSIFQRPGSIFAESGIVRGGGLEKGLRPSSDFIDQTAGAFAYGAADVGQALASKFSLEGLARELGDFKARNPQYAPQEVDSTLDLITSPKALVGRVFGSLPQVLLLGGAYAVPGIGAPLSAALAYAIESQRGYDEAKLQGADENTAQQSSIVKGVVNAAFNVLPIHNLFKFAQGAEAALTQSAVKTALGVAERTGATGQALRFIATQSLIGSFQGAGNELLDRGIIGTPVAPGFLDRRLQDAVGAGAASAVFGLSSRYLKGLGKGEEQPLDHKVLGPTEAIQKLTSNSEALPSALDLRAATDVVVPPVMEGLDNASRGLLRNIKDSLYSAKSFGYGMIQALQPSPTTSLLGETLDNIRSYINSVRGVFNDPISDVVVAASKDGSLKDLGSIKKVEVGGTTVGFTEFRRAADPTGVLNPSPIYKDHPAVVLNDTMNRYLGGEYTAVGGQTQKGGTLQPFEQPKESRVIRLWSPDWMEAMFQGDGRTYREGLKAILAVNPDLGGLDKVDKVFKGIREDPRRMIGTLEQAREIKVMPDVFYPDGPNGRPVPFLETDIYTLLHRSVEAQAHGIGWERALGSGKLKDVGDALLQKVTNVLGITPTNDETSLRAKLAEGGIEQEKLLNRSPLIQDIGSKAAELNLDPQVVARASTATQQELTTFMSDAADRKAQGEYNFYKGLFDERTKNPLVSGEELKKLAGALGIPTEVTRDGLIRAMESADPQNFTPKQAKRLVQVAKAAQGIKLDQPIGELYQDLIQRVKSKASVDVADQLLSNYEKEGGNRQDMLNVMRISQGIPIYALGRGPIGSLARNTSKIIGALQTVTASIPNLTQSINLIFRSGPLEWLRTANDVIKNYELKRSDIAGLSGIPKAAVAWVSEPGRPIENLVTNASQILSRATGLRSVEEFNNVMAGEIYRRKAESWKAGNFSEGDVTEARRLRLTPEEISGLKAGELSDFTYRKIVQNGIAINEFNTEAPYRKSKLENSPLAKMIFAYSNYALGMTRNMVGVLQDTKTAVRSGDPSQIGRAIKQNVYLLAGALGAGTAIQILRGAVRGNFERHQDDTHFDQAAQAIQEVALLGGVQRMLDPFKFDGGRLDAALVGAMPQVNFIKEYLGGLLGYGKYGKFDLDTRLAEASKKNIPIVKSLTSWINDVAYPELVDYNKARASVQSFEKKVLGREPQGGGDPINPVYYQVYQDIARGDGDRLQDDVVKYYREGVKDALAKGKDPTEVISNLRSSLLQRSPIPLNSTDTVKYLASQSPEKRREVVKAHLKYMALVDRVAPTGNT